MRVEMNFDEVCEYLGRLKAESGEPFRSLSRRCGVHPFTIRSYTNGEVKNRTGATLAAVAEAFGVKIEQKFIVEVRD